MSHLADAENAVVKSDAADEGASRMFDPLQKMSPSRKKQKVDDVFELDYILSQGENNDVDCWNHPPSPKSFQDELFTSGTFDFSIPATPSQAGTDLSDIDLTSPPEIRKYFSLDNHKMTSPRFPAFPTGDVPQHVATLSPEREEGSMFQEIQGRINHLSPGQRLYNVASNSDDGSPCRPHNWALQEEEVNEGEINSHCFNPPRSDLRKSRIFGTTKAVTVSEPITPSQAHIYQTINNGTSSADCTPDTKLSSPNAITNVSNSDSTNRNTMQYSMPSTWSQAPLPPFVSQGGSTHPELMPRPPQPNRYASFRGWNPTPTPQFLSPFHTGYDQAAYSFHPDKAHSSIIDNDYNWNRNQALLSMFQSRFGHCNVPEGYGVGTEYEGLHSWCQEQNIEYQKVCSGEPTTMTPAQKNILMSLGFAGVGENNRKKRTSSKLARAAWTKWMEKLTEYRNEHGNVDVPLKYEPCPSLGTFVNRQRSELKKMEAGKATSLTPERIQDLNELGFKWALRESHVSWEDRYEELKQFKDTNGHCNVPKQYPMNPALGYWVNEQRSQYRRFVDKKTSYMTEDKVQALKKIGFKWSMREGGNGNGNWDNWLKQLRAYKDEHGDTDVPLKYPKNSALGAFVNRQRTEHRKLQQGIHSSLTEERINSLNELGFKWQMRVSRTPWEQRLKELREFKEVHGHCNVPSTWPENQPLAYWVFKQRGQYRMFHSGNSNGRCNMTADRIGQLDVLEFEWAPTRRASRRSEKLMK
mmetsp:Transcript_27802/g.43734  ORF Transcript_27802/g.43734 Transcript_27802/m.43734 type:complete len:752 (-) Transcript_27802:44-2299(-)